MIRELSGHNVVQFLRQTHQEPIVEDPKSHLIDDYADYEPKNREDDLGLVKGIAVGLAIVATVLLAIAGLVHIVLRFAGGAMKSRITRISDRVAWIMIALAVFAVICGMVVR